MRAVLPLLLAVAALAAPAAALAEPGNPEYDRAFALGGQAFHYSYPLMEFLRVRATNTSVRAPDRHGNAPVNTFNNAYRLANPSDRTVVAPNFDTVYSIAQLDLGKGPVVLSHPDMGNRYFTFELLDPYTNVIGYIGSRTTGTKAGRFAITWTKQPGKRVRGVRTIRSDYQRVWVIGRTLVRDQGKDFRAAQALMKQYGLVPLDRLDHPPPPPKGPSGQARELTEPDGMAYFDAVGRALAENPPPARDKPLLDQLATVSIGPGLTPSTAGLSQETVSGLVDGMDKAAADLGNQSRSTVLAGALQNNGWYTPQSNIGDYGTDYDFRAQIAKVGLGANTPDEAIYPTGLADSSGALFNGSKQYTMTFPPGQAPPNRAFWSLTMYDLDGFPVPNSAHRYAIGSSHPGLVKRADGSIVVAIQHDRPTQKDVTWLPAPAGAFRLTLRVYRPTAAALSGAWKPPPVVPVS
jgi:hypothetical protein